MLEDKSLEPYIRWIRTKHGDAIFVPDTELFVANAMPVYFKEMSHVCISVADTETNDYRSHALSKWNSFQRQLWNYGFEKQDRVSIINLDALNPKSPMSVLLSERGQGRLYMLTLKTSFVKAVQSSCPK